MGSLVMLQEALNSFFFFPKRVLKRAIVLGIYSLDTPQGPNSCMQSGIFCINPQNSVLDRTSNDTGGSVKIPGHSSLEKSMPAKCRSCKAERLQTLSDQLPLPFVDCLLFLNFS